MVKFYTKDYDLSVEQLDDKYNPEGDGEHPGYPQLTWRLAVMQQTTRSGYWEWVHHELRKEEEELSNDSPFNTPPLIEDAYRDYNDYIVTWKIEVSARSPEEAAAHALQIQRDHQSEALHFEAQPFTGGEVVDVSLDFPIALGERPDNGNPVYMVSVNDMAIFNPKFSSCGRFEVDPMVAYGMTQEFVERLAGMNDAAGYDTSM